MNSRRRTPVIPPEISPEACTPSLRRGLIRENPLFRDLSESEIGRISEQFVDQGFGPGETIIREGDPAKRLYLVALGIVKRGFNK